MDEIQNPPQEEAGTEPTSPQIQSQPDQAKMPPSGEVKPDKKEAEPQQPLPKETPPQETQTQQPHLIQKKETKQKKVKKAPLPHKSFIVAVITILLTIALGVGMALLLANLTRG